MRPVSDTESIYKQDGSRYGGLPTPLTRFKVEKMLFSTLNRRNTAGVGEGKSLLSDFPSNQIKLVDC